MFPTFKELEKLIFFFLTIQRWWNWARKGKKLEASQAWTHKSCHKSASFTGGSDSRCAAIKSASMTLAEIRGNRQVASMQGWTCSGVHSLEVSFCGCFMNSLCNWGQTETLYHQLGWLQIHGDPPPPASVSPVLMWACSLPEWLISCVENSYKG